MSISRRTFMNTALLAGGGLALGQGTAEAIEPIRRIGPTRIRLSLAAYSYRRYLELNQKKQVADRMTYPQFVDACAELPLDAVEFTQYYFPETTPKYLADLKLQCTRLGLDVSGTAINNDFCVADPSRLKTQIAHVKTWVEHTSRLGGKTIRIFAGNLPQGASEERTRAQCVEAIQEACEYAGQFGIYLALENHGGIVLTIDGMLAIVQAVKSPWFGVNWDTGGFSTAMDPYADLTRLAPYAVVSQIKTHIPHRGGKSEDADLGRLINILRATGFRGYVALEYEATNEEPKKAVPRVLAALRKIIGG
jgi:sugar phosphate isomerase/epimerase